MSAFVLSRELMGTVFQAIQEEQECWWRCIVNCVVAKQRGRSSETPQAEIDVSEVKCSRHSSQALRSCHMLTSADKHMRRTIVCCEHLSRT